MKNSLRLSSNEKKLHNDRCIIFLIFYWVSEWVIVFFIAKSALLQLYQDQSKFSMRSWWGPFCTRPTRLVYLFVVLTGWNNSSRIDMSPPLGHIIQIPSQPVFALSAYCCVLSGEATNSKCYSLWFHAIGDRTHDLPHSKRAHLPLHHRFCYMLYWNISYE
jgi:hypothetical protein